MMMIKVVLLLPSLVVVVNTRQVSAETPTPLQHTKWLTAGNNGPVFILGELVERSIPVLGIMRLHEKEAPGIVQGSDLTEHCDQTHETLMCTMFSPEINSTTNCDKPFLPRCSCTKICGSMLQITYLALTKNYQREFIKKIAAKIPHIAKGGKNLAIVNPGCYNITQNFCGYILQILSPLQNDRNLLDFVGILRREKFRFEYTTSSEEFETGAGSYLFVFTVVGLGVPCTVFGVALIVAFFHKKSPELTKRSGFAIEMVYNDDSIDYLIDQ